MFDEKVLPQLEALEIDRHRPLLVVDVDEVLVGLAGHLGEFVAARGYALRLTGYQLDGALKRSDGSTASDEEFRTLFTEFFETETLHQRVYPNAASVLRDVSQNVQVIVLTNVPPYAETDRIENLRKHGIEYPLVVNHGGKGRALAWLTERTSHPIMFIDDSPTQIASVAKHAPSVKRVHYVGDDHLRSLLDPIPDTDYKPTTWLEIEAIFNEVFEGM